LLGGSFLFGFARLCSRFQANMAQQATSNRLKTKKKKAAHATKKTALKPVAIGSLSKTVDFDTDHLPELPTYKPLLIFSLFIKIFKIF
jgi:hypothetical protein